MRNILLKALPALLLSLVIAGCGGSDNDPSDNDQTVNGCFAVVGNKGTITATVSGQQNFSGIIQNGAAVYIAATSNTPANFTLLALDVTNGTSVLVGGPATVGPTTSALPVAPNLGPGYVQAQVQNRTCQGAAGLWTAGPTTGTATVTVSSVSAASVSGTFIGTLTPGSGATGNKTISGTFTATF